MSELNFSKRAREGAAKAIKAYTADAVERQNLEASMTDAQKRYRLLSKNVDLAVESAGNNDELADSYADVYEPEFYKLHFPNLPRVEINSRMGNVLSPTREPLHGVARLNRIREVILDPSKLINQDDVDMLGMFNEGDYDNAVFKGRERGLIENVDENAIRSEYLARFNARRGNASATQARHDGGTDFAPVMDATTGAVHSTSSNTYEDEVARRNYQMAEQQVINKRIEQREQLRSIVYQRNFLNIWAAMAPSMHPIEHELVRRALERGQFGLAGTEQAGGWHALYDLVNVPGKIKYAFSDADDIVAASQNSDYNALAQYSDAALYWTYTNHYAKYDKHAKARMSLLLDAARGKIIEDTGLFYDITHAFASGTNDVLRGAGEFVVGTAALGLEVGGRTIAWDWDKNSDGWYTKMSKEMQQQADMQATLGASTGTLGYSEGNFFSEAATGVARQIPLWATIALGSNPYLKLSKPVAPATTAQKTAEAAKKLTRAQKFKKAVTPALEASKDFGRHLVTMPRGDYIMMASYAGDTMNEIMAQGAPLHVALGYGAISAYGEGLVEKVQWGTIKSPLKLTAGQLRKAKAAGVKAFSEYLTKTAAIGTARAGWDITTEQLEEGLQASIVAFAEAAALDKDGINAVREIKDAFVEEYSASLPTMVGAVVGGRGLRSVHTAATMMGQSDALRLGQMMKAGPFDGMQVESDAAKELVSKDTIPSRRDARMAEIMEGWRTQSSDAERLEYLKSSATGFSATEAEAMHRYLDAVDKIQTRHKGAFLDAQYQYYVLGNQSYRDLADPSISSRLLAENTVQGVERMFRGMGFTDVFVNKASDKEGAPLVVSLKGKNGIGLSFIVSAKDGLATFGSAGEAHSAYNRILNELFAGDIEAFSKQYESETAFIERWREDAEFRKDVLTRHKMYSPGEFTKADAEIEVKTPSGDSLKLSIKGVLELAYGYADNRTLAHETLHAFASVVREIIQNAPDQESEIVQWAKGMETEFKQVVKDYAKLTGYKPTLKKGESFDEELIGDLIMRGTSMEFAKMDAEEGRALKRKYDQSIFNVKRWMRAFVDFVYGTNENTIVRDGEIIENFDADTARAEIAHMASLSLNQVFNQLYAKMSNADVAQQANETAERVRKGSNVNRDAVKRMLGKLRIERDQLLQGEQSEAVKKRIETLDAAIKDYEETDRIGLERAAIAINKQDAEISDMRDVETIREYNEMLIERDYQKALAAAATDEAKEAAATTRDEALKALAERVKTLEAQVKAEPKAATPAAKNERVARAEDLIDQFSKAEETVAPLEDRTAFMLEAKKLLDQILGSYGEVDRYDDLLESATEALERKTPQYKEADENATRANVVDIKVKKNKKGEAYLVVKGANADAIAKHEHASDQFFGHTKTTVKKHKNGSFAIVPDHEHLAADFDPKGYIPLFVDENTAVNLDGKTYVLDASKQGHTRFSFQTAAAQAQREYDEVVARYTNPDGTKKDGWLKAPNGKPTNLTERQWVQVRTPSFKKWFGDWEVLAEIEAMKQRLTDWTSNDKDFEWAQGKTLSECEDKFGNEKVAIAYIPTWAMSQFTGKAVDNRVYCSKGYFIDHAANHGHADITMEDYRNLQEMFDSPEEVIKDTRVKPNGVARDSLIFVKKFARNRLAIVELSEQDGHIVLHKSIYNTRGKVYPSLPRVDMSGGGRSPISHVDESTPGGSLSARDTNNVPNFLTHVNPENVSKVVDENGEPKIVYHGTYKHGFTVFKAKDRGIYTSTSKENADGYSLGKHGGTYALFANAKNPLVVDAEGSKWSRMKFKGIDKFKKALNTRVISPADLSVYAREHGYDGVVIKNVFDGDVMGDDVIVYQPTQLKSATDNIGTFDGSNPDVRFSFVTAEQDLAYKRAIEEGDLDLARQMVREAAAKAMPNTKVVDDDGLPLVVYHGTANGGAFTAFDVAKLSGSTLSSQKGAGFYFTNVKAGAQEYLVNMDPITGRISNGKNPHLFEVFLDIHNPIMDTQDLDKEAVKKLYLNADEWFIKTWIPSSLYSIWNPSKNVFNGVQYNSKEELAALPHETLVSLYLEKNKHRETADILQDLVRAYGSSKQDKLLEAMRDILGADGVIAKGVRGLNQYIAWSPAQIKSADVATYDDNGNLIPLSQRFNPYNDDTRFSFQTTRRPDLVGLHNMSEEGLKGADALGGFAMPSIAITRDSMGHNEFGDISLLMRTSAFNPKVNRMNKIYSRDAWTPTFPGIVNKPNIKHIIDVSERLLNTIPDNIRKAFGHNEAYRLLYEDGIQEKFNSSNTAGDAYGTNAALKAAYLISKGETIEPVMKPRTFLGRSNNRVLSLGEDGLRVINEAIGNLLVAFHSIPGAERIDWIDQHASEIEAAFIDAAYTSRIAKNPDVAEFTKEEVIGNLFKKNPLGFADVIDLADAVAELRKAIAKGEADAQIVDEYATKRAIDERVPNHDPAFEAWLDEQYGDPILARGIRNDKDYYTSSGKRRSWDALHDPVTLSNVVKVMLSKQRAQGEGFLGANPFGLTAAKFKSLKDVIKNEALLKELPKEEMDAIRDGFIQAFSEISERYSKTWKYRDSNPYTAVRESDDALLDAWADSKGSIAGLKRELNGYGRTADDELINDFKELMDGIAKFPTKYFEAKPMRGVGFDEVAAAIIPNNASNETREILNRRGVKMFEYEAGNETSRLAALNMAADEVEDTRFSVMSAGLNTNPNLRAEVEAALAFGNGQQVPARKAIEFSDVPAILKFAGIPPKRIFTQVSHVRKMHNKHLLTSSEIATLPEAYSTPIAIFVEGEEWIIITEETASAATYVGKPIQVSLRPARNGGNFIASAYARDVSAETRYQEMAKKSTCLYLDTEKLNASGLEERIKATLRPLAESVSVKTPQDFLASPYTTTISNSSADVKEKLSPANIAYAQGLADAPLDVGDPDIVKTENGTSRFSIASYEEGGRKVLVNYLKGQVKKKSLTRKDADGILAELDNVYEICKRYADDPELNSFGLWSKAVVEVDDEGNPLFGVVRPNGDYAYNIDFSTVCKKRRPLNRIFAELVNRGIVTDENIDKFLAEDRIPMLQDIIKDHGLEVACALCFVDSKRYKIGEVAKRYSNMHNTLLEMYNNRPEEFKDALKHYHDRKSGRYTEVDKKTNEIKHPKPRFYDRLVYLMATDETARVPVNAGDLISSEGLDNFVKTHPSIFSLYRSFGGVSKAKDAFDDVPYNNDIIRPFAHATNDKKPFAHLNIENVFLAGGVRVQSFSDFVPAMVFDYMQLFAEFAARGLPTHIYTKEASFVKIFGNIGAKINMSLVPAGTSVARNADGSVYHDADGNTVEVVANGLMRDKDGNTLRDANGLPMYDVVDETFPLEEAFRLRVQYGNKGNVGTIFVGVSDEHIWAMLDDDRIDQIVPYHKSSLNAIVAALRGISSYVDYTHYQTTKDPTKAAKKAEGEEMSEEEAKKGKVEKDFNFYADLQKTNDPRATANNYLAWCRKRGYTPKFEKFSAHRNYYKLLSDFRLFDNDGNYAPQTAVTAKYHDGVTQDIKVALLEHEDAQTALSRETDAIINEFVAATKARDRMEAAKKAKANSRSSFMTAHKVTMKALKSYDLGTIQTHSMIDSLIENRARAEGRDISPNEVKEFYENLGVSLDPFSAQRIAKVTNEKTSSRKMDGGDDDDSEAELADRIVEMIHPGTKGLGLGGKAMRLARSKGISEGVRAAQRIMNEVNQIKRIKREEFEAAKGLRTPEFEAEMGFSITRTMMALNDAYGRASDEERLAIDERYSKRAAENEERINDHLDLESPIATFAEDEMTVGDFSRYLELRKALQEAARKTRDRMEALEEKRKKKREADRLAASSNGLSDEDVLAQMEEEDADLDQEMQEEEDAMLSNFRSILDLNDPNELVWFVQQFCAYKKLGKMEVNAAALKQLSHDPIFVRDFAMTLANIAETLANGMVYSRNREQVKQRIADLVTAKSLSTVRTRAIGLFIRIHEARVKESRKEIIANLRKFLKKAIVDGRGALKVAKRDIDRKVTADIEEEARMIRAVLAMGSMAVRRAMVEVENIIHQFDTAKLETEKNMYRDYRRAVKMRNILNIYGGAKHFGVNQLMDLAEETTRRFSGELEAQVRKREEAIAATESRNKALIDALTATRKDALEPGKHSSLRTKAANLLDAHIGLLDLTMDAISRQGATAKERARAKEILQVLTNHFADAGTKYRATSMRYKEMLAKICIRHYGSEAKMLKRFNTVIDEATAKRISMRYTANADGSVDADSIKQRTRLTVGQVLQLKMSIQQEDYTDNALRWHRDNDCIEAINSVLIDTDLAWAKDVQHMLNETFAEAQQVYKAITGYTVGTTPNYWPVKVLRSASGLKGEVRLYSDVTNIMTPRVPHALDFDESVSAFNAIYEKLDQQAHMIGYAGHDTAIMDTLCNGDVRRAIRLCLGDKFENKLQNKIQDVLMGPKVGSDGFSRIVAKAGGWFAGCALAFNPTSVFRQVAGWAALIDEVGFLGTAKALARSVFDFSDETQQKWRYLRANDAYSARYNAGFTAAMDDVMRGDASATRSFIRKIVFDGGLAPLRWMDMLFARGCTLHVFDAKVKKYLAEGLSTEEAHERAATEAWSVVETNQQSSRVENQFESVNRSQWARLLVAMRSGPLQAMQYGQRAIAGAIRGEEGAYKRLLRHTCAVVLMMFIDEIVTQLVAFLKDDDDELFDEEHMQQTIARLAPRLVFGNATALPIVGEAIEMAANRISGAWDSGTIGQPPALSFAVRSAEELCEAIAATFSSDDDANLAREWFEVVRQMVAPLRLADQIHEGQTGEKFFEE